jgi:hypothetical protein
VHAQQAFELSALRPARIVFAAQQRPRDRPDVGPAEEPGQDRRVRVEARLDLRVVEILEAQPSRIRVSTKALSSVLARSGASSAKAATGASNRASTSSTLCSSKRARRSRSAGSLMRAAILSVERVSGPRAQSSRKDFRVSPAEPFATAPPGKARSKLDSTESSDSGSRRNPSTQLAKTPPAVRLS